MADEQQPRKTHRSLAGIIGQLASTSFVLLLLSIVTGPLQARALGPGGRGELAAIAVPAGLLPVLLSFGLGSYATFAVARERDEGTVLGTIGLLYIALGLVVAAAGIPLAAFLADGRHVVFIFLAIVFAMAPINLLGLLLLDMAIGAQTWRPVIHNRLATSILGSVPIPILYVLGDLTVVSASIVAVATVMGYAFPLLAIRRRRPRLSWSGAIAKEAARFGVKAWIGGIANQTNVRLDQLLMIRAVSSVALGRYAVAVNLSGFFIGPMVGALLTSTSPRIARGETGLVARSSRTAIAVVGVASIVTAVLSPFVLRYLFGPAFDAALPAVLILLAGSVPAALNGVLASAVSSAGHPGIAAAGEGIGILVTVPGLIILLGPLGILGAAAVSFGAYSCTCGFLIVKVRRHFGGALREYLVPDRRELRELLVRGRGAAMRLMLRLRRSR